MKYFDASFATFYKNLAANNNRDWFLANKADYEKNVKKPFERFVGALIETMAKHDKRIAELVPSQAIFRINRDVRFSKDKTPYKLHSSAVVSAGGKKSERDPGIYVEMGPEKVAIAGGIYMPGKEELADIRAAIAAEPKKWKKAVESPDFVKYWGDVQGEKNKVLPADLKELAKEIPHLYNKQFYYWVELDTKWITSDKLISKIEEHYVAAKPVSQFLAAALS